LKRRESAPAPDVLDETGAAQESETEQKPPAPADPPASADPPAQAEEEGGGAGRKDKRRTLGKKVLAGLIALGVVALAVCAALGIRWMQAKTAEPTALSGPTQTGGHTYRFYRFEHKEQTWDQAKRYCKKQGGHLATISSVEENLFLYGAMTANKLTVAAFGYSDEKKADQWMWVQKEKADGKFFRQNITFSNWHEGEPAGLYGTAKYAVLTALYPDGTWQASDFGSDKVFICEWDD
jgi:hypothetical protein